MRILISNDDGILAPGIAALVRAFSAAGHEVCVCAPDSQRSAASHSLTIGRAIPVKEMPLPGAARAYAIGGTPVDCVKLGLSSLCPQAEAVVSGVNHGYNAGSDVLYSGTVAAAMEGALCGRPALAISLGSDSDAYDLAAQSALHAFALMTAHPLPPCSVLNVNYPACGSARGLVTAPMQVLHYDEHYERVQLADGQAAYVLSGEIDRGKTQSGDYAMLCQGYATMTVIGYDMTDYPATDALRARTAAEK